MKRRPVCAILIAAMSLAVHKVTGGAPRILYTGLIGGIVRLLLSMIGLSGWIRNAWPVLAVAAVLIQVAVEAFVRLLGRNKERAWEPIPIVMLGIMLLFGRDAFYPQGAGGQRGRLAEQQRWPMISPQIAALALEDKPIAGGIIIDQIAAKARARIL